MPEKHPNTIRWGGPGASHEDATKPMPDPVVGPPEGAVGSRPRVSQVSGGGGERDEKHSHVDGVRSSKSHATDSPSPTDTRAWRKNRSRNDRAADAARLEDDTEVGEEARSFQDAEEAGGDDAADVSAPAGAERGLQVLVNTDNHLPGTESVAGQVEAAVRKALRRFQGQLTHVEVFLADENGSRSGPGDKRCSIEARPAGSGPLAASDHGSSIDEAVAGALAKLSRVLESELGKRRDHRRRGETIRGAM
ncbi:HPF/RaiA family ribosome-associated protein [Phenylobacterium sp.]|uniref:HPF/RaiA family ribosome-associated protein n=1 Tax=Phenylobacterium sp. TaxID=1871053 RepID=UPI002FE03FA1